MRGVMADGKKLHTTKLNANRDVFTPSAPYVPHHQTKSAHVSQHFACSLHTVNVAAVANPAKPMLNMQLRPYFA